MPDIAVTFWLALFSAAAALFAAATAGVVAWLHFRNARDAVRPELAFEGWGYRDEEPWGGIGIHKIRNFGRGPALHLAAAVSIPGTDARDREGPGAGVSAAPLHLLAPGAEAEIKWEVRFSWRTGEPGLFPFRLPIQLSVFYHDLDDRLHKLTYYLVALRPPEEIGGACMADKGLVIAARRVQITPAWQVRMTPHLQAMKAGSARLYTKISEQWLWEELWRVGRGIVGKGKRPQPPQGEAEKK